MLFRDVVDLLRIDEGVNENGFSALVISKRTPVFANKKSVRQSEFYQASMQGIQLELMFEIRATDYNGENALEFEGKQYTIKRTFDRNNDFLELICSTFEGD